MIWYDTTTKQPVAPGGCEDSGYPSIEGYVCYKCHSFIDPEWQTQEVEVDTQVKPVLQFQTGSCTTCGAVVLTTLR